MKRKRYTPTRVRNPKSATSSLKVSQKHVRVYETEAGTQEQKEGEYKPSSMNNTTTIIIAVVGLLLSGFFNYHGNKPWILYFPLAGILLGIAYWGHCSIQSYYYVHALSINPTINPRTMTVVVPTTDSSAPVILAKQDKAQDSLNKIEAMMASYQKSHAPDLAKEFPLGYSLFTMKGRSDIIPFKQSPIPGVVFEWDTASVSVTNDSIGLTVPNIEFAGGGYIRSIGTAVPNKAGAKANVVQIGNIGLVFKIIDSDSEGRMAVLGLKPVQDAPPKP